MLDTGSPDPSLRLLLREGGPRWAAALDELRERVAGFLALALVLAVPLYGMISGSELSLVEESVAAEPNTGTTWLEPPKVNHQAALSRLGTNSLSRSEIRAVQARLKQRGFDPGPIDGLAGKRTLAALNAWRQSIHLAPARVVSRGTVGALHSQ
jgi:hypothetical protein